MYSDFSIPGETMPEDEHMPSGEARSRVEGPSWTEIYASKISLYLSKLFSLYLIRFRLIVN